MTNENNIEELHKNLFEQNNSLLSINKVLYKKQHEINKLKEQLSNEKYNKLKEHQKKYMNNKLISIIDYLNIKNETDLKEKIELYLY